MVFCCWYRKYFLPLYNIASNYDVQSINQSENENEGEGSSPQKTGLKFKLKENFSVFQKRIQKSLPHPT